MVFFGLFLPYDKSRKHKLDIIQKLSQATAENEMALARNDGPSEHRLLDDA